MQRDSSEFSPLPREGALILTRATTHGKAQPTNEEERQIFARAFKMHMEATVNFRMYASQSFNLDEVLIFTSEKNAARI